MAKSNPKLVAPDIENRTVATAAAIVAPAREHHSSPRAIKFKRVRNRFRPTDLPTWIC
jgi:hypothetical protein